MLILSVSAAKITSTFLPPSDMLLELRLENLTSYGKIPLSFFDRSTIATLRKPEYTRNDLVFLKKLTQQTDCLFDCEKPGIVPTERLIYSLHFYEEPDFASLDKAVASLAKVEAKLVKLSFCCSSYEKLFFAAARLKELKRPYIITAMGFLGEISRFLYRHLGSFATYVCLPNMATAKGQITVQQAKSYGLANITDKTAIGGIVGGEQVKRSLGLAVYNRYFLKKEFEARYFAFPTKNYADFTYCFAQLPWYGFSITMPFKKEAARHTSLPLLNCITPLAVANTDLTAFRVALQEVEITDNILIYGSGASAENAIAALSGFPNVHITGRDKMKVEKLRECHGLKRHLNNYIYEVIINCTPVGAAGENFFAQTNLPLPKYFIDLPYGKNPQYMTKVFTGKRFWQVQAKEQKQLFYRSLGKNL